MSTGALGSGLRLALGTLTVLPVGNIHPLPPGAARVGMVLAPAAILPIAVLAGVVGWLAGWLSLPGVVVGALVLAVLALGTRAMHLDGLADTVDGFGGGWTRERALEIMRSGDVGPMGVTALVLNVLVQAGCLGALASLPRGGLLIAVVICVSRFAVTVLCARPVPAARGSGMGAVVAGSVPVLAVVVVGVVVAGALSVVLWLAGTAWWWGLVALGIAVVVLLGFGALVMRKFGGVTGDVMGAGIELTFSALLIVMSVPLGPSWGIS